MQVISTRVGYGTLRIFDRITCTAAERIRWAHYVVDCDRFAHAHYGEPYSRLTEFRSFVCAAIRGE